MMPVIWSVEYLVEDVVARCDEAHGQKPEDEPDEKDLDGGRVGSERSKAEGNDHPGENEYVLEPVIDARDLDQTAER
jgi:hypothetical protein